MRARLPASSGVRTGTSTMKSRLPASAQPGQSADVDTRFRPEGDAVTPVGVPPTMAPGSTHEPFRGGRLVSRDSDISVVIPMFNRADLMLDTLQAVLSQTVPAAAVIVVDD